jgi:hypothetical protein
MAEKISKHKTYGFVYGISNKTPLGRLAWVNLVTPKESTFPVKEGDKVPAPRYELTLLLKKSDPKVKAFVAELELQKKEMVELFNEGKKTKIGIDEVIKDGDEMDTDSYPFYAGNYYMVPKKEQRPPIYDSNVEPIEPGAVIGGMPGLCVVRPICTSHGISYQLLTVQLGKDDGVRFGGGKSDAKALLTALGDEDDAPFDESAEETPVKTKDVVAGKAKAQKGQLNLDKLA